MPCSGVLLNKLHLLKKFTAFYGTRRFISIFAKVRQLSLPRFRQIHSTPLRPIYLNHPSTTNSSKWFVSLTKTFRATLLSPIRVTRPTQFILLRSLRLKYFSHVLTCLLAFTVYCYHGTTKDDSASHCAVLIWASQGGTINTTVFVTWCLIIR
jgi:hypothetical protein